jgi:hypothetical protein
MAPLEIQSNELNFRDWDFSASLQTLQTNERREFNRKLFSLLEVQAAFLEFLFLTEP